MMKKLVTFAWFSFFFILTEVSTNVVHASARLSFLRNPQELEPRQYVTIIGDVPETSRPFAVIVLNSQTLLTLNEIEWYTVYLSMNTN